MLVLKWYGIELKGNIYDTMLVHYVVEPEGRRSMDLLSANISVMNQCILRNSSARKARTRATCVTWR